ncbi:hypothetical protein Tco_1040532 [Tanacetum coccineum]
MVEGDDEIKVLGEINIELESRTHKPIEKLSQEKDSQEEALEEFNSTLENVAREVVSSPLVYEEVAKEVMEMANDQDEALSDQEVADDSLDDEHVEEIRPSKKIRVD